MFSKRYLRRPKKVWLEYMKTTVSRIIPLLVPKHKKCKRMEKVIFYYINRKPQNRTYSWESRIWWPTENGLVEKGWTLIYKFIYRFFELLFCSYHLKFVPRTKFPKSTKKVQKLPGLEFFSSWNFKIDVTKI